MLLWRLWMLAVIIGVVVLLCSTVMSASYLRGIDNSVNTKAISENSLLKRNTAKTFAYPSSPSVVAFSAIELSLAQIPYSMVGGFHWDMHAASYLGKAAARIPDTADEKYLASVLLLIRKSFMGDRGDVLAEVFKQFYFYRHHIKTLNDQPPSSFAGEMSKLAKREQAQKEFMGETMARALWGKQNSMAKENISMRWQKNTLGHLY